MRMEKPQRDFNTAAEIFLGLSMFSIGIRTLVTFIYVLIGATGSFMLVEIVFNVFILIAIVLTFQKKRYGLIALIVLFIARMLATMPPDGIEYSDQMGRCVGLFMRDLAPFAIAMCFKKKGEKVSGWRSMLASNRVKKSNPPTSPTAPPEVVSDKIEASPKIEDVPKIEPPVENVEPKKTKPKKIKKPHTYKRLKSLWRWFSKNKWLKIGIPAFIGACLIAMAIIVLAKDYPDNINGFGNKFRYCFSMPNNKLAKTFFEKYQNARDEGLEEMSKEYLATAWEAKPNDLTVLDSLASAYFSLGLESKNEKGEYDKEFYDKAELICHKMLQIEPSNVKALNRLARIYYNTKQRDKAYKIAEQLYLANPHSGTAIRIMCLKYYDVKDWNNLVQWGKKGYELEQDSTSFWAEMTYLYAKGLYETGYFDDAKKYYFEAEKVDSYCWARNRFVKIGGKPCSISSVLIKNETYNGEVINRASSNIYDDNTQYLVPVVRFKVNRNGGFDFDIKLYCNGTLQTGKNSPPGYSYRSGIAGWFGPTKSFEITLELGSWGSETPGTWPSGRYRIEIWWEGEKLFTKHFNIYSGYWHNLGYGNRID